MRRILFALLLAWPVGEALAADPPSKDYAAMAALRCTLTQEQLLDRITQLEAQVKALQPAEAK